MSEPDRVRVGGRVSVYPRGKKNTYVADFWQDGVHRKVSLKTANKKVAVERATAIAAGLIQGHYRQAPAPVELRRACDDYVVALTTDGRARKTTVKYAGVFRTFLDFLGARRVTKVHQVTASAFDAWRAGRAPVRHPMTVYTEGVVVKQFFKWATSRGLLADDPLAGVRLTKPRSEPRAGPSLEQVDAILAAAAPPLRDWLTVLALTGMRVGELQRLRREDVDLKAGWVHVRSRPGAETKTRESRKVPMAARLRAALGRLPPPAGEWYFTAGRSGKYPRGGNWINPKKVNDQFARLLRRLGMPAGRESGFVVHSLRHFFETVTVNAGVPQRAIDTWLGHRSDKSMASVYYSLHDRDSQEFMAKVPFGPGAPELETSPTGVSDTKPQATG